MEELLDLLVCDQYNWSKRKFCTNKAIVRITFTSPADMWLVCNCHAMNLAKYNKLKNATWERIK